MRDNTIIDVFSWTTWGCNVANISRSRFLYYRIMFFLCGSSKMFLVDILNYKAVILPLIKVKSLEGIAFWFWSSLYLIFFFSSNIRFFNNMEMVTISYDTSIFKQTSDNLRQFYAHLTRWFRSSLCFWYFKVFNQVWSQFLRMN